VIHPVRPWFWLALLFAACQWLAPSAIAPLSTAHASVAGVTCSANITSITFGNVDPSTYSDFIFGGNGNSNLQTTGFLTYTCQNITASAQNIAVCASLKNPGGTTQRSMAASGGGTINYQLYQDAGNTTSWGSKSPTTWGSPYAVTVVVPANGVSAPVTVPIYATIASSQFTTLLFGGTGSYSATYGGGDVALDTGPAANGCAGASGGGSITGFTVSANVALTCQVTTNPLTFPVTPTPSGVTGTATLTVNCNDGDTGYKVGLDNGKNYDGSNRRMRGGPTNSDYISYGLFQDSNDTIPWGNTVGSNTQTGTSKTQTFTVYGKVNTGQGAPPAGTYFDAVTVYVYY